MTDQTISLETKMHQYCILDEIGDYTLIHRNTNYQPFVVCWLFHEDTYTWEQGHYFSDMVEAEEWMCARAR